jgi:methylmalonyl-CoA mutase N-terminal domain/subunit
VKRTRHAAGVTSALRDLGTAAKGTDNLMPYLIACVEQYCTVGEISDALRDVWGEHTQSVQF